MWVTDAKRAIADTKYVDGVYQKVREIMLGRARDTLVQFLQRRQPLRKICELHYEKFET